MKGFVDHAWPFAITYMYFTMTTLTDRQTDGHDQLLSLAIRVTPTQGKHSSSEYVLQCMYHTKVHAHVHTSTEQLLQNREASLRSAVLIITSYQRLSGVFFIMKHMGTRLRQ